MNSGSEGANPDALTFNEFDGYLNFNDGADSIHMGWHVLPRRAANLVGRSRFPMGSFPNTINLTNNGAGTAQNDAYALIAVSGNQPEGGIGGQSPTPDIRAVGVNTFPVPAGFCSASDSFVWVFAVNSWERQAHLLPVVYIISLDIDQDGTDDALILNSDASGGALTGTISDGRQVTFGVFNDTASAFFFTEHATNTGNTVLVVCAEQVGLSGADLLTTNVDVTVEAFDFYFGGPGDFIAGITVTPFGERYFGLPNDIPAGGTGTLDVFDFGTFPGNTEELGILLMTNGDRGTGARGGATQDTESLLIMAK
jgi:hypothetical protein